MNTDSFSRYRHTQLFQDFLEAVESYRLDWDLEYGVDTHVKAKIRSASNAVVDTEPGSVVLSSDYALRVSRSMEQRLAAASLPVFPSSATAAAGSAASASGSGGSGGAAGIASTAGTTRPAAASAVVNPASANGVHHHPNPLQPFPLAGTAGSAIGLDLKTAPTLEPMTPGTFADRAQLAALGSSVDYAHLSAPARKARLSFVSGPDSLPPGAAARLATVAESDSRPSTASVGGPVPIVISAVPLPALGTSAPPPSAGSTVLTTAPTAAPPVNVTPTARGSVAPDQSAASAASGSTDPNTALPPPVTAPTPATPSNVVVITTIVQTGPVTPQLETKSLHSHPHPHPIPGTPPSFLPGAATNDREPLSVPAETLPAPAPAPSVTAVQPEAVELIPPAASTASTTVSAPPTDSILLPPNPSTIASGTASTGSTTGTSSTAESSIDFNSVLPSAS